MCDIKNPDVPFLLEMNEVIPGRRIKIFGCVFHSDHFLVDFRCGPRKTLYDENLQLRLNCVFMHRQLSFNEVIGFMKSNFMEYQIPLPIKDCGKFKMEIIFFEKGIAVFVNNVKICAIPYKGLELSKMTHLSVRGEVNLLRVFTLDDPRVL
ncbi:hypothetical protein HHI36_018847 [Cryptolaemus montrouzieri]|uniref:Galectin n=1 Tax=Cryptolaemus montrouzieri TaxID=559131 RepID=A0ABD2P165_9CUCU